MKWSVELVLMIDAVRDELGITEEMWQDSDDVRTRVIKIARNRMRAQ